MGKVNVSCEHNLESDSAMLRTVRGLERAWMNMVSET